jgi:hypothetical protein
MTVTPGPITVTSADFQLHGRIENYRERLTEILVELDRLVREQMEAINTEKLGGTGKVIYETRPPRWTLAWRAKGGRYEANLMAFAQGGAFVIHGRVGLDRPFRNFAGTRERDVAAIRDEILGQLETDVPFR